MEKIFADRCPRCGEIFEYTEEATLLKCEFCQHTFRVAEFMSQRQKLAQQLEAGEVAKQALVETQAEKTKLQERLNNTLTALELIQSSQAHEESALNNVLEVLEEDRQMHDAMAELLRAMRSEQATGQDALSQLLCTMMQEQSSVEGKLNEVQALVTRILDAQLSGAAAERKMRREIQDEIDQLKINEELKGKLAEDFYDWSREMHEGDLQRLKALQSSSRELLAEQHAITERLMHMDSAIREMSTTVTKGFDTLYQQRLEKLKELYHQATGFQVAREFDKAEEKYLTLLVEGGEDAKDAEVYWRLLLCHYGIEYQKDEEKLIPIILRPDLSPMESLDAYQNLKRYIKTDDQRKFYHAQLEKIDFYLQRYREVKQNPEWQYDVFISVKQSYGNQPTKDSVEAMKLYHRLVSTDPELAKRKLKVFNSAITKPPANEPYEPYIITALMSAKVLIVVGSRNEFMNSQWVKNEWSRFQYLQETDIKKTNHTDRKLLCYLIGGMSTYDIPGEMKDRQAIVADADAGDELRKVIEQAFPAKKSVISENPEIRPAKLVEHAFVYIADGLFEEATVNLDRVLKLDPKNSEACLGKLMIDLKVCFRSDLAKQEASFADNLYCKRILRYGNEKAKAEIRMALDKIDFANRIKRENQLKAHLSKAFDLIVDKKWTEAKEFLDSIVKDYPDAAQVYLYRLLAEFELTSENELCTSLVTFENTELWDKVCQFSDEQQKEVYKSYVEKAKEYRNKQFPADALIDNNVNIPDGKIIDDRDGVLKSSWVVYFAIICILIFCDLPIFPSVSTRFDIMQPDIWTWLQLGVILLPLWGFPLYWLFKLYINTRNQKLENFTAKVYHNNEIVCRWTGWSFRQVICAISVDNEWFCMTRENYAVVHLPDDQKRHRIVLSEINETTPTGTDGNTKYSAKCIGSVCFQRGKQVKSLAASRNVYSAVLTIIGYLALVACMLIAICNIDSAINLTATNQGNRNELEWTEIKYYDFWQTGQPGSKLEYVVRRSINDEAWEVLGTTSDSEYIDYSVDRHGTYTYQVEMIQTNDSPKESRQIGTETVSITITK